MTARAEQKTPGTAGRRRLTALVAAAGLGALVLTGCGGQSGGGDASASSSEAGGGETTLRVSAAASLTQSFDQLADKFEKDHPGVSCLLYTSDAADDCCRV